MEENPLAIFYILGSNLFEDKLKHFVDDLTNRVGDKANVKYANIEEEEGSRLSDLYDIKEVSLPAILLIEPDETFYTGWYGEDLPDLDTLDFELTQIAG